MAVKRKSLVDILDSLNDPDISTKFLQDYIYAVEKIDKDSRSTPSRKFKPSSLQCDRGAVYQVLGIEEDKTESTHNIIDICKCGTDTHLEIQTVVDKMNDINLDWKFVDVSKYVKEHNLALDIVSKMNKKKGKYETKLFSPEYNCSFLCDGVILHHNKYYILEIKTIHSRGFWGLKGVLSKHKQQAISYCTLLGIRSVIFLYVDRDLMNKKAFMFTPSIKQKTAWVDRLHKLNDYVKNKTVPAKPIHADSKFCQYCNYKSICRSAPSGEYIL